jgi:hypothetical protein
MRAYWSLQFDDSIGRSRKIDQTHSFVSWAQSLRTCPPQEGLEDTNEYQCNKIVGEIVEFETKGKRDKAESGLYQKCDAQRSRLIKVNKCHAIGKCIEVNREHQKR